MAASESQIESIASEYGRALAEECDLPEHQERFTDLFRAALRELASALKGEEVTLG